jgi:hypothetical protein
MRPHESRGWPAPCWHGSPWDGDACAADLGEPSFPRAACRSVSRGKRGSNVVKCSRWGNRRMRTIRSSKEPRRRSVRRWRRRADPPSRSGSNGPAWGSAFSRGCSGAGRTEDPRSRRRAWPSRPRRCPRGPETRASSRSGYWAALRPAPGLAFTARTSCLTKPLTWSLV